MTELDPVVTLSTASPSPSPLIADQPSATASPQPPPTTPAERLAAAREILKVKRSTAPWRAHSLEEIDTALTHARGIRREAAAMLKMSDEQLKSRIHDNPVLKNKWNRKAVRDRALVEFREANGMGAHPAPKPIDKAMAILVEFESQAMVEANLAMTRRARVNKRIELGEEARCSPDPDKQKYAFKWNDRGDPAEERMLREQANKMLELEIQLRREARQSLLAIAEVQRLQNQNGHGGYGPNGPKKAKPGFAPKGQQIHDLQP